MQNDLIELMRIHRITLPPNAAEWRVPLQPTRGYITGITTGEVRLLCLDGIVGWFANSDGSLLFGHLQHFVETKEKRERKSTATPKTGIKSAKQAVLDELKTLLGI